MEDTVSVPHFFAAETELRFAKNGSLIELTTGKTNTSFGDCFGIDQRDQRD